MSILDTIKKVMPYLKTDSGYVLCRLSSQAVEMDDGLTLEQKVTSLNSLIESKVDTSSVVNNALTTEEGFVLDARQGKELDDKITELNGNLTPSSDELIDGVTIIRCGRHRVLQISNATSPTAGDIVRLPDGDIPPNYVMGSASYRGQTQGDYFISITPKSSPTPGKVGLFRGNNAATSVDGPYIVAHIDWYV